ncbi:hypothetical protein [Candidatus Mycolicibacterium alkanivorans]|uniref:Uncharacterized protein n=1 Tax=Candidatus Mycolicibacterium alkanivorans TaxID=2954114 RepID=A0ABS9YQN7_9MYCO|nr:hypothetical protein [Candidatus Mycolicibacterium alkanivorans]MCI4673572.1 hypothetical protein [Candidatus Mycolicibacterium alkanivorans]
MTPTEPRPRAVEAAFWLLVVGAVLLLADGLLAAALGFDTLRKAAGPSVSDQTIRDYLRFHRGSGVVCALAAVALAALAVRTRAGDPRFRRATMGLGLAIVVLVGLIAVFFGTHIFALLSLVPIIVGTLLLSRPPVAKWFNPDPESRPDA